MGNTSGVNEKNAVGGRYGYRVKLPEGFPFGDEEGWEEEQVVRFDECVLSLVSKHPPQFILSGDKIYILRDTSVTHLCVVRAKVEESLLVNQLSPCRKIPLGRNASYVVYGICEPPSVGEMGPGTLCLIRNKWFDEDESREMSEFKVSIEFHSPPLQGMLNEFLLLITTFRSLSNENQIQFRNLAHSATTGVFDLYALGKTMDNFTIYTQSKVKRIFYE